MQHIGFRGLRGSPRCAMVCAGTSVIGGRRVVIVVPFAGSHGPCWPLYMHRFSMGLYEMFQIWGAMDG